MSNATIEAVVEESTWYWTYDDDADIFNTDVVDRGSFQLSTLGDNLYLFVSTEFSGDTAAQFKWYLNDSDPVLVARQLDEVIKRLV